MPDPTDEKNIYSYLDYREFLRDRFTALREKTPEFSYRFFAQVARVSPSFLKLVATKRKHLSQKSVFKFAKALGLDSTETNFFNHLVLFNRSKTLDEQNYYYSMLCKTLRKTKAVPMPPNLNLLLNTWYVPIILEMVGMKNFKNDSKWISKKLGGKITPKEAQDAIELLLSENMLITHHDGTLSPRHKAISTGDQAKSLAMKNFHKSMIELSLEKLNDLADFREYGAVTASIGKETVEALKQKIREFRKELLSFLSKQETGEDVYQLNIQLFSITKLGTIKE